MKWKIVLPIIVFLYTILKISGGVAFIFLSPETMILVLKIIGVYIVVTLFVASVLKLFFPELWRFTRAVIKKEIRHEIVEITWFSRTCKKHLK